MGKRYTKFNSNYLMRSNHQDTKLGRIMERDWVTTTGMNVLRFGSGRRIWYNSGSFVFTTSNIPTYHKKHKLTTETKEWAWDDVLNADGTVNNIAPSFNTNDLRDYAYYGSCVELIRATIEEIVSDFPGCLTSTNERPLSNSTRNVVDINTIPNYVPSDLDISYELKSGDAYIYVNGEWKGPLPKIINEERGEIDYKVGDICYDISDGQVKILCKEKNSDIKYFESYGIPTGMFNQIYYYNGKYYKYVYETKQFEEYKIEVNDDIIDGFILKNQFNIDLHHKRVTLGKNDNPMRFMGQSYGNYCVIENGKDDNKMIVISKFETNDENDKKVVYNIGDEVDHQTYLNFTPDEKENLRKKTSIAVYEINDGFDDINCPSNNEGKVVKTIKIETFGHKKYEIKAYSILGRIVYTYMPSKKGDTISLQPTIDHINEYFSSLVGFKKQLLRQDTKPFYSNRFITPIEQNFKWYYPEKVYIWPSDGYCIDVDSMAFSNFVENLYDMGQNFDELWSDNLYRSMTHEAIKNFDWTYSREYYDGEAQDNIDGGERMQKIIRVLGRAFDDVKLYIDTIKLINNTTYDKIKNTPDGLLSDNNNIKGVDVVSTISSDYDINTTITTEQLKNITKSNWWVQDEKTDKTIKYSQLPRWYVRYRAEDVYPDICDNEFMRRLSLSAKRIMNTKGTQQAIEMVLGLFGLGKYDENTNPNGEYILEEEAYYTEKMIRYDECVDGTLDGEESYVGDNWSENKITEFNIDWKKVDSHKKGALASEINANKRVDLLYDTDPLSGVPMRTELLGRQNVAYLVPYYDSTQLYDGDLIFQGKGGWGKMVKTSDEEQYDDKFDYQETLSYLHVVGNIGDMLATNPNALDANAIYYVVNLNDYTKYDENPPMDINGGVTMSHFFILVNHYESHKFYAWKNIVVKPQLDTNGNLQMVNKTDFENIFGGSVGSRDWFYSKNELPDSDKNDVDKIMGCYVYAFKKMQYLDNIFSTNVANNPHVGYGKYDDGQTFIEYMKLPFKHLIDEQLIENSSLSAVAQKYQFDDIGNNVEYDKIQIMNTRKLNNKDGKTDFVRYNKATNGLTTEYTYNEDKCNTQKRWYINTKVLTISYVKKKTDGKTLDNNRLFSNYFKSIIMPYLMQVIPSTTILKLKDFVI